ncbi:YveK family protein [Kineococcus gypseus]|uniref:YveK family protein n=1 Tax=Kineococcus gypseus TaxID=1637102 RepID=UPI003D7DA446
MSIGELWQVVRRRRVVLAVFALVPLLLAVVGTALLPRTYEATAQVYVSVPPDPQDPGRVYDGSAYAQSRAESYALLARTRAVTEPVVSATGFEGTPEDLAAQVSASVPLDTVLIELTVSDASAQRAAELADAVGEQLTRTVGELEGGAGALSAVELTLVQPATVPSSPASPSWPLGIGLGVVAGLALGLAAALVAESLSAASRRTGGTAGGAPARRTARQELLGAGIGRAD